MTRMFQNSARRLLDILLSTLALVSLSPLLLLIALVVKIDSDGPVFFKQLRVGRGGKLFVVWKFRSMQAGAQGRLITLQGDKRITRVGKRLRRWKLDELPQLWNVLVGQMSLVGPRPEVPEYVAVWKDVFRDVILSVRPGLTDPATLSLIREEEMLAASDDPAYFYVNCLLPEKTACYVHYVNHRTLRGDYRLLLSTASRLFSREKSE